MRGLAVLVVAGLLGAFLTAQELPPFHPTEYQVGKDVVWEPTPTALVEAMLDLAHVTTRDTVLDLGSGDGRIVIAAAKRGARASGVEYDPRLVALARYNARQAGVANRATFVQGDLFATDLTHATVITLFLLPSLNLRLEPFLLGLRPGTRIVSNTFTMGDWVADRSVSVPACTQWCWALLWIVPPHR